MVYSQRIRKTVIVVAIGCLLASMASAVAAVTLDQIKDRGYIRIAVANEAPYGYMTAKGDAKGFGPATAKHVLKTMGVGNIQWSVMPFGQLIEAVNAGMVDMVAAGQAILPERCEKVLFSRPNTSYGEGLLVLAGNPLDLRSYGDIAENADAKLGIVEGASQVGFAHDANIGDDQIVILQNNTSAIDALTSGKIDAYAATQFTAASLAQGNDKVQAAQPYPKKPFALNPFKDPIARHKLRSWGAFTFAKDSVGLRDAFNQHLQAFQQTDAWRDILHQYGLDQRSIEAIDKKTTQELCAM